MGQNSPQHHIPEGLLWAIVIALGAIFLAIIVNYYKG